MCQYQQHFSWNQKYSSIEHFQMHAKLQDLCSVIRIFFLENSNVKSRVYENTLKIFPNIQKITLPDWWTHWSWWKCLHKNHKRHVWIITGSHHILQSTNFSHGATRQLSIALHNWNIGPQNRRAKVCLCVDDFGVKYFSKNNVDHPLEFLKKNFAISTDSEGRNYLGLTIDWNYNDEFV